MTLFYNETTRTWYDPRAPIVGKYAQRPTAPRRQLSGPRVMQIHNMHAARTADRAAKSLQRRYW